MLLVALTHLLASDQQLHNNITSSSAIYALNEHPNHPIHLNSIHSAHEHTKPMHAGRDRGYICPSKHITFLKLLTGEICYLSGYTKQRHTHLHFIYMGPPCQSQNQNFISFIKN